MIKLTKEPASAGVAPTLAGPNDGSTSHVPLKRVKSSELSRGALEWAIAKITGRNPDVALYSVLAGRLPYSTDWALGGPLVDRYIDEFAREDGGRFWAATSSHSEHGPTLLIACMRAIAGTELGMEVDVPEELLEPAILGCGSLS